MRLKYDELPIYKPNTCCEGVVELSIVLFLYNVVARQFSLITPLDTYVWCGYCKQLVEYNSNLVLNAHVLVLSLIDILTVTQLFLWVFFRVAKNPHVLRIKQPVDF